MAKVEKFIEKRDKEEKYNEIKFISNLKIKSEDIKEGGMLVDLKAKYQEAELFHWPVKIIE